MITEHVLAQKLTVNVKRALITNCCACCIIKLTNSKMNRFNTNAVNFTMSYTEEDEKNNNE